MWNYGIVASLFALMFAPKETTLVMECSISSGGRNKSVKNVYSTRGTFDTAKKLHVCNFSFSIVSTGFQMRSHSRHVSFTKVLLEWRRQLLSVGNLRVLNIQSRMLNIEYYTSRSCYRFCGYQRKCYPVLTVLLYVAWTILWDRETCERHKTARLFRTT